MLLSATKPFRAVLACLIVCSADSALAQTFPSDDAWLPVPRGGVPLTDPSGDAAAAIDVVGTTGEPAAFVHRDAGFTYFRLRLDATPELAAPADGEDQYGWVVEIVLGTDLAAYDLLTAVDASAGGSSVVLRTNTDPRDTSDPKDRAESLVASYSADTHARVTIIDGGPAAYVDWAVPNADLADAGLESGAPLRLVFGTIDRADADRIDRDLVSPGGGTTLSAAASALVVCDDLGCFECDDPDGDLLCVEDDNCPDVGNADQDDMDSDGTGDACDPDVDGDGTPGDADCDDADPDVADEQTFFADPDGDGFGNPGSPVGFCATSAPAGYSSDDTDNCPNASNPSQTDSDGDGLGDACDGLNDADGDGSPAGTDCDDTDPDIHDTVTYFADPDGDDVGSTGVTTPLCELSPPSGFAAEGGDNCPLASNPGQDDLDDDGSGDVCDSDDDGDGVGDAADNCPTVRNTTQIDRDDNGVGDACEADRDGDGLAGLNDNCPAQSNVDQADLDSDGWGDVCDSDADGDGSVGAGDCDDLDPSVTNERTFYPDADGDGIGESGGAFEACRALPPPEATGVGGDNCLNLYNPDQADIDGDQVGDDCDGDRDGDGVSNAVDNCPFTNNPAQSAQDCEGDRDGDGDRDENDNCRDEPNPDQADLDGDESGDACDDDVDGDGVVGPDDCDDADDAVGEADLAYRDLDGDGVGQSDAPVESCGDAMPEGYVDQAGDNCPNTANADQADADSDGIGDLCDAIGLIAVAVDDGPTSVEGGRPATSVDGTDFGLDASDEVEDSGLHGSGGGPSCSASGGTATPLCLLLALLWIRRPWRRRWLGRCATVALAVVGTLVAAAAPSVAQSRFDVQRFAPLPSQSTGLITLSGSQVLNHLQVESSLLVHYASAPLVVVDDNGNRAFHVVDDLTEIELTGAVGLFDVLDLGLAIPVIVGQTGDRLEGVDDAGAPDASAGVGDIRLVPRAHLFSSGHGATASWYGLALLMPTTLPTGSEDDFRGGQYALEPRLAFDVTLPDSSRVALNLGYALRPESRFLDLEVDDALTYGVGTDLAMLHPFHVVAELSGEVPVANDGEIRREDLPVEVLAAGRLELGDFIVQLGAGAGLVNGVGTPDYRLFASVGYAVGGGSDADDDGVLTVRDMCPRQAEDRDGVADADGCPDPDNDADGIVDASDTCPLAAEDRDGIADTDGCPDFDDDGDGVAYAADVCPQAAEDIDLFQDADGCPEDDNDDDGISDDVDECAMDAEDLDGYGDEDGCPEADYDDDGLADAMDRCPDLAAAGSVNGCPD